MHTHWWFVFIIELVGQVKQFDDEDPEHVRQVGSHDAHRVPAK